MSDSGIKPKGIEILNGIVGFLFGFKNTKGEVLSHWIAFADGFTFSSTEFYDLIEKELGARKIPSMEMSRVEFKQGGWISEKRLYLRLMRERLALDTCAAPFGNTYFFSCRTVYVPALIRLWHILAVILFFNVIGGMLMPLLGLTYSLIAEVALVFALAFVFRNATAMGLADLDAFLLKIPAFGIIYERIFREDTYYRMDTRILYLKKIPEIIQAIAEEITATKGLKLVEQFQATPVFGDLYKPHAPRKKESNQEKA